ncbi:MAG: hypothetical protein EXS48_01795 [Candidatus Staskawiczbacteria bacterium]|nr:hypothetical protein [Candidatus Staskawiczbacteria bacterium]
MDTKYIDELFIFKRICGKCEHGWFPRATKPQRCPRCQTWLESIDGKEALKINEVPTGKTQ